MSDSSRKAILNSLRERPPAPREIPADFSFGIQYPDPLQQFLEVLASVGGTGEVVTSLADIQERLSETLQPEDVVANCVPGLNFAGQRDLSAVADPHALDDIELAIVSGELAVAENAAIWVSGADVPQRVLYFLCQHLAIVVPREQVVHNLHEAYERLKIGSSPFGCWISGPSKTADIEQSLVKGAHGARSLRVFILDR